VLVFLGGDLVLGLIEIINFLVFVVGLLWMTSCGYLLGGKFKEKKR
jgi:hypothetical protein